VAPRASAVVSVRGLRIGHAESAERTTGVTAAIFDRATPAVADVRGGASATYDLASLSLDSTFGRRWGIFFAGGSLFGLDAAAGVREAILASGGGQRVFRNPRRLAPVAGAALFDLPPDRRALPDYRALGRAAAESARSGRLAIGPVGAGRGALVGKYRGRSAAMRGGVGWAQRAIGRGAHLGALVAANAVGAVRDPAGGRWVAGARSTTGRVVPPMPRVGAGVGSLGTTLTLLVTDLAVDRPTLQRIAAIAHAGLGGAIVPFQSSTDGDVLFAGSTGAAGTPRAEARPGETADRIGTVAAELGAEALVRAVRPRGSSSR
jgi:L-aminopeptidase/D-esterase-like protein